MNQAIERKRRQMLVVDDHAEMRELLRLRFEEEGFTVATARTGSEAVKQARALLPDLILLDVLLPELDGFAVCEILRRGTDTGSIPIIMVTGLTGQISRCAGIESGATDFVTKPVSPAELVSKVTATLNRGAATSKSAHPKRRES